MFKFRSGTHGLNEELGRHRGREGRKECLLCDDECESVSHVLWDCPVYNILRNDFLCKLQELLGDGFEHFESLDSFEKASFVLDSELWEDDFSFLGMGLNILRAWIVLKKHLLFWVVSCGRMTLALCLILLRTTSLTFGSYGRLGYMT